MIIPDSKVHGINMGPIWGKQDPGGPHVGPVYFVIWDTMKLKIRYMKGAELDKWIKGSNLVNLFHSLTLVRGMVISKL